MMNRNVSTFDADAAYRLYQSIMAPIVKKFEGKSEILIFPDGPLTSIPLGMLITSAPSTKSFKNQDWLIRAHAITILPSIYALKTMRSASKKVVAPKQMIAFADPVFANQGNKVAVRSITSFTAAQRLI
jgi:CHAT domain-containing protein